MLASKVSPLYLREWFLLLEWLRNIFTTLEQESLEAYANLSKILVAEQPTLNVHNVLDGHIR